MLHPWKKQPVGTRQSASPKLSAGQTVAPDTGSVRLKKRSYYPAAAINRITSEFCNTVVTGDTAIYSEIQTMRSRARDLERSNGYVRKFLSDVVKNVIGSEGVKLQNTAKFSNGKLDRKSNDFIEQAWKKWQKSKYCTVTKKIAFHAACCLAMRSIVRDGEVLVRLVKFPGNPFGFALQLIEGDILDHNVNRRLTDGTITMGVEKNTWGEPRAYWLSKGHPGDMLLQGVPIDNGWDVRPAEEILHLFLPDRITQSRGFSWIVTAIRQLKQIEGYDEAEVIAARVCAAKHSYLKRDLPESWDGDEEELDANQISGEPGGVSVLPAGYDLVDRDPKHPTDAYEAFKRTALQGIASSLQTTYSTLSSDFSQANYSSERAAQLDIRETWKMLQNWFIDEFLTPVFEQWLLMSMYSGQLRLSVSDYDRLNAPVFYGRRWDWVDPMKDLQAKKLGLELKITSRREIAAEQGGDIETIFSEIEQDKELMAEHGLEDTVEPSPAAGAPTGEEAQDDGEEITLGNPYKIVPKDDKWQVVKQDDGKVMGTFASKTKALKQLAALEIAEHKDS